MRFTALMFTVAAAMPFAVGAAPDLPETRPVAVVQDLDGFRTTPPVSWLVEDPADSLYRQARSALQRSDFTRSAQLFHQLRDRYPRSGYVPDSFYWEAFSLYRGGSTDQMHTALDLIRNQRSRYPRADTASDAAALEARIRSALAQRGDEESAKWVQDHASSAAETTMVLVRDMDRPKHETDCNDDDDIRVAAINGLLQMDADRAIPILKRVLARRDAGSECLRRKAVFLVAQKRSTETEDILLDAVRNDPDAEVRRQGVFWLSQVATEKSVNALDSILRNSRDEETRKAALFALSQQSNPRASQILRDYATREDSPEEVREQAIFWMGQHKSPENAAFLQGVYAKTVNPDLKEKVLFSLAQMGGAENIRWIMAVAMNEQESMDVRKQALFWAGQSGGVHHRHRGALRAGDQYGDEGAGDLRPVPAEGTRGDRQADRHREERSGPRNAQEGHVLGLPVG